jgi:hypothetical protein
MEGYSTWHSRRVLVGNNDTEVVRAYNETSLRERMLSMLVRINGVSLPEYQPKLMIGVLGGGMDCSSIILDVLEPNLQEGLRMKNYNDLILEKVSELCQWGTNHGFLTEEGMKKYEELVKNAYTSVPHGEMETNKAV